MVDKGEGQRELAPYTTLAEHDDLVSALAAAPSAGSDGGSGGGQTLATGSWDCGIRLWNLASPMNALREFTGASSTPDRGISLGWDGSRHSSCWPRLLACMCVYKARLHSPQHDSLPNIIRTAHVAPVTAMAWHPFASTQELLASASRVCDIRMHVCKLQPSAMHWLGRRLAIGPRSSPQHCRPVLAPPSRTRVSRPGT